MIDLSNIKKPKIDYYPSSVPFADIISGQVRVHNSTPNFLDFILFEERICSFFRVYRIVYASAETILLDTISDLEYIPSSLNPKVK